MTFRNDLQEQVQSALCRYLGGALRFVDEPLLEPGTYVGEPVGAPPMRFINALRGAGAWLCDTEPLPLLPRPTNGNCVGTLYEVEAVSTQDYKNGEVIFEAYHTSAVAVVSGVPGAIGAINTPLPIVGGGIRSGVSITADCGLPNGNFELTATNNNQNNRTNWNQGDTKVTSARITKITAITGPDNCPGAGQPITRPPLADRTITIVVGPNSGIVQFGAGNIAINGDVNFPLEIQLGPFSFNGNISLFGGGLTINLPVGGPGDGLDFPPFPPPPNFPPPENTDGLLVGALVEVSSLDLSVLRSSLITQGSNPDIYGPRLGSISFYVKTPQGWGWTEDIPVKNRQTYIPCGTNFGAFKVSGTPLPGVIWDIIPIKAPFLDLGKTYSG